MAEPEDAFDRLLCSPLFGPFDGPVERDGASLRGITKRLYDRYGGGHLTKRIGRSTPELGLRVHREVRDWVAGERRVASLHSWTLQAIALLDARGLRPVSAEVPIAHGKLGTRVDLVVRRAIQGDYALASLKTGIRRGPDAARRLALPAPFSDIKRCERTLDDLQIAAERGLARKGHRVLFAAAYVIEVPEGVIREAPAWTSNEEKQDALLRDLEGRKPY